MNYSNASPATIQTSFADYLEMLEPDVPTQLVAESCFTRIKELASHLPGFLAFSPFGFECPLGEDEAEADFLFSLQACNSGHLLLAGEMKEHDFDKSLFKIPQWSRARRFGELWANPPDPLFSGIDNVWMEFDLASAPITQDAYAPSFFCAPFKSLSDIQIDHLGVDEALNVLATVFLKLNDSYPPAACLQQWKHCLEILPNIRSLYEVGFMIARPDSNTLRLCIVFTKWHTLKVLLHGLGWSGDFRNLDSFFKRLNTFFDHFTLHIDLGKTIGGKIGIECMFPYLGWPVGEQRWSSFLDLLTGEGLCRTIKRNALRQYPGYRATNMHACPIPLKNIAYRQFPLYRSFFVRIIYHIKLVLDASGEWQAKAYIGINHYWKSLAGVKERDNGPWGIIC